MLNANQQQQKKNIKKKAVITGFEPKLHRFKDHHGTHYAMEANGIIR